MRFVSLIRYAAFMLLILPLWGNAATVAMGEGHTCALTSTRGVQCWGYNWRGQLGDGTTIDKNAPVAVSGLSSGVQAIAAGGSNTCALTTAGDVQCWGYNVYGELGDGSTTQRLTPVAVSGLGSGVQAIAMGQYHTCALTAAGGVKCWGYNGNGRLGDGTTTQRLAPVAVTGLSSGVQAIAAGIDHTCALTTAGGVQCWGVGSQGKLGNGTTTGRATPAAVTGLSSGVQAITAGTNHTCALTTGGGVLCWGDTGYGQLGDGTSGPDRLTPVAVNGLSSGVQAVAAGDKHTCALTTAGGVQCWGYNFNGQLGDGTTTSRLTPVAVSGLGSGGQAIVVGQASSCAQMATGGMQCWGYNYAGILGNGTTTNSVTPVPVNRWGQIITVTIAAPALGVIGVSFPVAASSDTGLPVTITTSGGCSLSGNTVTITSASPVCTVTYTQAGNAEYAVTIVSSVTSVDTDGDGTADAADTDDDNDGVLDSFDAMPLDASDSLDADFDGVSDAADTDDDNDTVLDGSDNCPLVANLDQTDSNADGQGDVCEPPAIAAGSFHSCALSPTGGVQCWGGNSKGQLGDGTTTTRLTPVAVTSLSNDVQAITAGWGHTCVLTTAGGVQCWGFNGNGQLGDGTTTDRLTPVAVSGLSSGVQAIATGNFSTCALTTAGGVQCWGQNDVGQLGDGTTTQRLTPVTVSGLSSGVQAIATGNYHTCALTNAGGVQCWGSNGSGQLGDGTTTQRLTPVAVSDLSSGVQAIAAGGDHTCALTTTGDVKCWGGNFNGELGDGTTGHSFTPVAVDRWAQIITVTTAAPVLGVIGVGFPVAATSNTGLPVTITVSGGCSLSDSTVTLTSVTPFCTVTYTQAGNAEYAAATVSSITSVDTDGDSTPNAIDTDDDNDGALDSVDAMPLDASELLDTDTDGSGNNADTDDDNDTVLDGSDNCPLVVNLDQADSNANGKGDICELPVIAVGAEHTCALTTVGGVQCWGANFEGQLGDGTTTTRLTPVTVSSLGGTVQSIVAGYAHTCALMTVGGVQCWGRNQSGQLGDDTIPTNYRDTPLMVSGLSRGVRAIASVGDHTCALTTAGAVNCWGNNYEGQLGVGFASPYRTPPNVVIGLSSGVQTIAAGSNHMCALTASGGVQCWGGNGGGQLGDGTKGTNRLTPVAVSGLTSGVQAITAGWGHTCALTTAGGVQCWGDNGYDQLGDGTTTQRLTPVAVSGLSSGVQAIAAGYRHTCALTTTGDVQCWGYNDKGQLGDGTVTHRWTPVTVNNLNNVVALAAGRYHTCALTAAGRVQCWGLNIRGQLGDGTQTQRLIPGDVLRDGDGDGVLDTADAFPLNPAESVDTDHDGIGNNVDTDDDDDGVPDSFDSTPLGQPLSLDGSYQGSSIQESAAPL